MSRQSKQAKNNARAAAITELHRAGRRGPSKTTPRDTDRRTMRKNPARLKTMQAAIDDWRKRGALR